jgi:hypothetical protein
MRSLYHNAIGLQNWLLKELREDVAVFELLGGMTLCEIGMLITQTSVLGRRAVS